MPDERTVNMPHFACTMLAIGVATFGAAITASGNPTGRSVFLNGEDISSARNQKMTNVTITIDEDGNILVDGPQYRVHQENTYTPLSRLSRLGPNPYPAHKPPQAIKLPSADGEASVPVSPITESAPATAAKADTGVARPAAAGAGDQPALIEKAGQSAVPPAAAAAPANGKP
jgi:hypothetical protein